MAGERLENYVWKISTIAKVWKVFGWTEDEEKEASNISRKFPGILKGKLKMSDEELNNSNFALA